MRKVILIVQVIMLLCSGLAFAEESNPLLIPNETVIIQEAGQEIVKWDRVPLRKVIVDLADKFNVQVIINGKLDGTVVARYANTSFEDILSKLAKTCTFKWARLEDGSYIVSPADNVTLSKTFKVMYANKDDLKNNLSAYIPKEKIAINPEAGTVTVDANIFDIAKAAEDIKQLDKPAKLVTIQVKIVEVNRDDAQKAGFNYALDNIKYDSRASFKPQWTTTFNAESIFTSGNVLARPTVTTVNGRAAKIVVTEKVPIFETKIDNGNRETTTRYEPIGLDGTITPTINEDGEETYITLDIHQKFSSLLRINKSDNVTAPVIAEREAKTIARVKNKETIIIGGLIKDEDRRIVNGLPFLKDLPVLGPLFRNTDKDKVKTEMFIYITPIINNGKDEASLYSPKNGG